MSFLIRDFIPSDYAAARRLWERCEGVGLSAADEEAAILSFLERNPAMSLAARNPRELIGTALVGHDGRRGFIHHLAVDPSFRNRGVGSCLVEETLTRLRAIGIQKCHAMVFADNEGGRAFWSKVGASHRLDLTVYSLSV